VGTPHGWGAKAQAILDDLNLKPEPKVLYGGSKSKSLKFWLWFEEL